MAVANAFHIRTKTISWVGMGHKRSMQELVVLLERVFLESDMTLKVSATPFVKVIISIQTTRQMKSNPFKRILVEFSLVLWA